MKMNKEKFLKSEFGKELEKNIDYLIFFEKEFRKTSMSKDAVKYREIQNKINMLYARWSVYQLAIKNYYNIEYNLSITNEYYGICNNDETDWLFKKSK